MGAEFTTSLIQRLHLRERFEQIHPTTMEGKAILQKYDSIFERYGDTVSGFHNFLLEASNSNDDILKTFSKVQSNNISLNCPKSWHFGLVMEQLQHSGNPINEATYDDLKYLLTYNESDLCEAVAHGAFKNNMQVGALRTIYESITGETSARKLLEGNVMFSPISYVEIRDGKKYFMVEGKVYEDDGEELHQDATAPSPQFSATNNVIQKVPYNPDIDGFVCNFLPAAVNVTSGGDIYKDKESWDVQAVEQMVKQEMEDQNLPQEQKIQEARKFDDFKLLYESLPSCVRMDNITAVKNIVSGKSAYLFEGKHFYILTNQGIVARCNTLNEAVSIFTKYTGVNLRGHFAQKLNEELKARTEMLHLSEALRDDIEKAEKIVENCNKELQFCTEGTPKYNEFMAIREDAEEYIKIMKGSVVQMKM